MNIIRTWNSNKGFSSNTSEENVWMGLKITCFVEKARGGGQVGTEPGKDGLD